LPVRLPSSGSHQVFIPRTGETLDIEETAEAAVLSLRSRFALQSVYFDPWQAFGLAQRLTRQGVKMEEFAQTPANLTMMASNLLDIVKLRQFVTYPSDELRQAVAKTVAIEGLRGSRLGKSKASDRVDLVIALAMATFAVVQTGKPQGYAYKGIPRGSNPDSYSTSRLNPNCDFGVIAAAEDAESSGSVRAWGMGRRRFGRGSW
jgi:phage terminase large subunit-like protein